jgi:chemotaxis protein MotB
MFKIRIIVLIIFLGFSFYGCAALEYFDGSSKEEIARFQNPQAWDQLDKLRASKMNSDKKINELEAEVKTLQEKEKLSATHGLKNTYSELINNLKSQLRDKDMTIKKLEKEISITFVDRILFESGRATITPEGKNILHKVGTILKKRQGMQIRVMGYTDNIPIKKEVQYKFPSNWELSAARASAVVRYFQNKSSIDPRRLEAVGRSFYSPIANNNTDEGRSRNRRVEIVIGPNIEKHAS